MRKLRKLPAQVLYRHGRLMMYRNQGTIRQDSQEDGIFVVVSGLVRVTYNAVEEAPQEYFLGTGGQTGRLVGFGVQSWGLGSGGRGQSFRLRGLAGGDSRSWGTPCLHGCAPAGGVLGAVQGPHNFGLRLFCPPMCRLAAAPKGGCHSPTCAMHQAFAGSRTAPPCTACVHMPSLRFTLCPL